MGKKQSLYSTTNQEDINYTTEAFEENKATGNADPPIGNPYLFSTIVGYNPNKGVAHTPYIQGFSRNADDVNRYDEGFAGESYDALNKYRVDTQGNLNKGFNAIVGGLISGVGTFVEDVGYMTDIDTYKAWFTNIDFSANKQLGLIDYIPSQLVSSGLQNVGEGIKNWTNESMPIYENEGKSLTSQVFNWNALKSTIDSVVGFALAGWGAGAAVKGLSKLAIQGLVDIGKFSEAFAEVSKLKNVPSVVNKLAEVGTKLKRTEALARLYAMKYPVLVKELGPLATSLLTKSAEARMEGLNSYNSAYAQLEPLIQDGTITKEYAIEEANKAANHAFDMTKWTFAGDALMLRKMFTPKANLIAEKIMKPGIRSTLIEAGKNVVLGAPKEGLEEMWQQKAQMEGVYDIYNDIKGKLNESQKKAYIDKAGFDPEKTPDNFVFRSIDMMLSTQGQVAGILGAIAGPFQSALVGSIGRKERNKQQLENYNRQQEVYKGNEALFNASNQFIEQVKIAAASDDMVKFALDNGNDKMLDYAKMQTFANIAIKNFVTGTHDQLRDILKANPSEQSTKFIRELDSMENSFAESKRYVNAEEVFLTKTNIKRAKELVEALTDESTKPDLDPKVKKEYTKGIERANNKLQELNNDLKEQTSFSHQMDLHSEAISNGKLMSIYVELPNMNSLYQLEQLQKDYPSDEAIKERLRTLKDEKNIKVAEPNTPNTSNTVSEKEKAVTEFKALNSNKDLSGLIAEKEKLVKSNIEHKQDKLDVLDKLIQEKKQPNKVETNVNGLPIFNDNELNQKLQDYFATDVANDKLEQGITPSKSDYEQFKEEYKAVKDNHKTEIDREFDLATIALKLYSGHKEITEGTVNENSPVSENSLQNVKDLKSLLDLTALTEEDFSPNLDPNEVDIPQMLLDTMKKLYADALLYDKINLKKDFKTFIEFINKISPELAKTQYDRLAGLYVGTNMGVKIADIPTTYNEAFGITITDLIDDGDMPTTHKLNQVFNIPVKYISPDINSEELMNVYMNEEIVSLDKLNEMPATSMAFLSQPYVWTIDSTGKKVKRFSSINDPINGDNILNPNKFNSGDKVNVSLDEDYDDVITLSTGEKIQWKELQANANDKGDFNKEFYSKHNLGKKGYYETLYDYTPIKIHTDVDGTVAYIHDTAWINKLNAAEDVIEDSRKLLKNFRKKLIDHLKSNTNTPLETTVLGKAIGMAKDGGFRGGVINKKSMKQNAAKAFPAKELMFADKSTGGLHANGNKTASKNVINSEKLVEIHNNMIFTLMPVGKINGVMQYWAEMIYNNKLSTGQAKTIRQVLEIFVSQDSKVNQELYDKYINHPTDKIDLKSAKDLDKFLKKLVYLYHNKELSIGDYIKSKATTNPTPVMTLDGQTIKIGKSSLQVIEKGKNISKERWDIIENNILKEMLFNISKNQLNTNDEFHYSGLNDKGVVETFEGNYNEFMKPNTSTMGNSTLLKDGSYGYVIQPVTRFDMMIKELEQPIVEQKQEPVKQTSDIEAKKADINRRRKEEIDLREKEAEERNPHGTGITYNMLNKINDKYDAELAALATTTTVKIDYSKRPEVIKAVQDLSLTYEEFYNKYLQKIESGKVTYEQIMSAVNKLVESKKNNEEQTKCTN
jgi:hypothetical protein